MVMHLLNQLALFPLCASQLVLLSTAEPVTTFSQEAATLLIHKDLVTVRISVFDEVGPLSGAIVSVDDGTQSVITDATGNCQLNTPGGTTLLVSASGHKTYRLIVSARGGESHTLKLRKLDGSEIVAATPLIHVSGVVLTPEGKPMPAADVSVAGRGWSTKTDQAGRYEIDVPQNNILSVSKFGYEPKVVAVLATTTTFSPKMALWESVDPSVLVPDAKRAQNSVAFSTTINYKLAAGEVITEADENPMYPGGSDQLNMYLLTNVRYPEEARQSRITGQVLIRFVVNADGSINRIRLLKGLNYGTDEEAVRVVARMPNWTPGKLNGRPVAILYTLPIAFSPQP